MNYDRTRSFDDRRRDTRHEARLEVNYRRGDTYLFSRSSNISELGIFLMTNEPLLSGAIIELRFNTPRGQEQIEVTGEVMWVDPGEDSEAGMGIRFINTSDEVRRRIKTLIRTVAYLD